MNSIKVVVLLSLVVVIISLQLNVEAFKLFDLLSGLTETSNSNNNPANNQVTLNLVPNLTNQQSPVKASGEGKFSWMLDSDRNIFQIRTNLDLGVGASLIAGAGRKKRMIPIRSKSMRSNNEK